MKLTESRRRAVWKRATAGWTPVEVEEMGGELWLRAGEVWRSAGYRMGAVEEEGRRWLRRERWRQHRATRELRSVDPGSLDRLLRTCCRRSPRDST